MINISSIGRNKLDGAMWLVTEPPRITKKFSNYILLIDSV